MQAQDIWLAPLQFYGRAEAPPEASASAEDRRIAHTLRLEYLEQAELAKAAQKQATAPHVKRFAESILNDAEIACARLARWDREAHVHMTAILDDPLPPLTISALQGDEATLETLRQLCRRQLDRCQRVSPLVTPAFRNELELLRETAWRRSQSSAHLLVLLAKESKAIARR